MGPAIVICADERGEMNRHRFMTMRFTGNLIAACFVLALYGGCSAPAEPETGTQIPADPLPSWNDGASKQAIVDFVARVTDPESPDFVPELDRIATFDNDGTLWGENPLYFQILFAADRVRALAPEHPEWANEQPFKAILEDDREALGGMGLAEVGTVMAATHAGVSADEFAAAVRGWLDTARHPRFDRPFDEVIYQPMLEVLDFLRANGFKTFIVSGGGIEFIRTFSYKAYGIPADQVIGSSAETEFRVDGERTYVMRLSELHFNDDKEGKPVAINRYIGRRPIATFGNSDGDFQMLQYGAGDARASLQVIVHHDDAEREYAYDRDSSIGRLNKALDEAATWDITVVSMKDDWNRVFPFDSE